MLLSDAVVPGMRAKLCARQEQINGQLAHLAISRWNAQSLLNLRSRKVGTMPRCVDAASLSCRAAPTRAAARHTKLPKNRLVLRFPRG
jgi:hypothetical protein